ncbi:putative quorum-quenching lactonase YtnP [Pigmentiphaga humi]|uniref:Putative quorum-quenching lactonase YtnP n=1 Tax=Pigmentiphaga humi TaxID=2478468 RepID=A0A3P4AZ52_9BURK|nr:MBL fold metallo-hydrolase [Pigmentiphaga humi]VCU68636.1 putative quorum-quenching lactonase YtnP [Pigmentiphaga humi]
MTAHPLPAFDPGLRGLRVGDVSITRIEDYHGPGLTGTGMFPALLPDMWEAQRDWLVPHFYDPQSSRLRTSIHSWLVVTPHHKILIDCCIGNHKNRPSDPRFHMRDEPWLQRLAAAGAHPDEIDFVMCTHFHADHVGWNTCLRDGRWVPTFRNARYLFKRAEFDRWDERRPDHVPRESQRFVFADSILPVVESGQAVLIDDGHVVDDRLTVEPAPGHTAGNATIRLRAGGDQALFSGDVIHHPIQLPYPALCSIFDDDPVVGLQTRLDLLAAAAQDGLLLLPTHFAAPFHCRVRAAGAGFLPSWPGA